MAPRPTSSQQRRSTAPAEQVYDLGVRGRKTGVELKDTGARDEHGMQPIEDMFSDNSPGKETRNGAGETDSESEEEPMDIDEVTAPAPSAFMKTRPPASPPKANLMSPARRAPGFSSSPLRAPNHAGSPYGARGVQRQLDFTKNNGLLANKPTLPRPNGLKGNAKPVAVSNDDESASSDSPQELEPDEESMAILNGGDEHEEYEEEEQERQEPEPQEEEQEEEEEEEQEEEQEDASPPPPPPSAKKSKRRQLKKAAPAPEPAQREHEPDTVMESIEESAPVEEEPVRAGKKRGRPAGKKAPVGDVASQPAKKKTKRTLEVSEEQGESSKTDASPKSRGRPAKTAANTSDANDAPPKPTKKRGPVGKARAKQISTGAGDTSVAEVPRGPPLPGTRGLFITRRETPLTSRFGRAKFRPLKFWANERTELENDDAFFDGKENIVLPRIKNIVRVDDPEPGQKVRRKGKATSKGRGRKERGGLYDDEDDDDDLELWEEEGDIITGEVVVWQPEHELYPPGPDEQIEVATGEQIAVSANAITTREIRGANFKFAKTLSMPFFGSGVVDLPPGSEKKPKNSRKMHMSFFVFAGRVQVTVGDTVFSIGRGGMWFVPRGNFYGIENVSNKPARVFFSQGCELNAMANPDASQMASQR